MDQNQRKIVHEYQIIVEKYWGQVIPRTFPEENSSPPYQSDFGVFLDNGDRKIKKVTSKNLQPWLSMLELGIEWISSLHIMIDITQKKKELDYLLPPWALTGTACSQAVAIRKLCILGLDGSARIILRSLIETLNICTAILFDPKIGKLYKEAQESVNANKIWNEHFRRHKMIQIIRDNMKKKIGEEEDELIDFYLNWQDEELQLLNQSVHSSYIATAFSSMAPSFEKDYVVSSIFGSPTIFSYKTIEVCTKAIWFFALIGFTQLLKPIDNSLLRLIPDKKDGWTRICGTTWHVFTRVVEKFWDAGFPQL